MDIVTLKTSSHNRKRSSARRHTTEVSLDQLPSKNRLSPIEDDTPGLAKNSLTSSWNTLFGAGISDDLETSSEVSGSFLGASQADVLQEISENHINVSHHQYQLSYELAQDNILTPFVNSPVPSAPGVSKPLTHVAHVIKEMVTTEKAYVGDLSEIIEGYIVPMETRVGILHPLKENDLINLFGNVMEIRDFNLSLLKALQDCGHCARDVGQCFLDKAEGFKIYTEYCNNYPTSVRVLTTLSKEPGVSHFFKICQQRLNHMLPLGAYLLKPVQRVLKYSLLLRNMAKHMKRKDEGHDVVHSALEKMTDVAEHINATKKKYEAAVHVQEIQSLIRGWEVNEVDLTKCGDLVLQENFRCFAGKSLGQPFRGRTERYLFLFQRLFVITKKDEDGYQYKTHLEMKDIQLTERVEKDSNSFQIRQVSTGRFYTFQAQALNVKEQWVKTIKELLMASIPHLPDKAKLLILAGFPTDLAEVMKRTPNRQRHSSEDFHSPSKRDRSPRPKGDARTIHGTRSAPEKGVHRRSTTTPNFRVASPTHSLVQASMTGFVAATVKVFQPPVPSVTPMEEDEKEAAEVGEDARYVSADNILIPGQRDSGFSESLAGNLDEDSQKRARVGHSPLSDAHRPLLKSTSDSRFLEPVKLRRAVAAGKDDFQTHRRKALYRRSTGSSSPSPSVSPEPHDTPEMERDRSASLDGVIEISHSKQALPNVHVNENGVHEEMLVEHQDLEETLKPYMDSSERGQQSDRINTLEAVSEQDDQSQYMWSGRDLDNGTLVQHSNGRPTSVHFEIIDPPTMFSSNDESLHASEVTEDSQRLFDEMMGSATTEIPPYTGGGRSSLDRHDASIIKGLLGQSYDASEESTSEEAATNGVNPLQPPLGFTTSEIMHEHLGDETPKASPFSIRRWTVQKKTSPNLSQENEDLQVTPKVSPQMQRHAIVTKTKGASSSGSSIEDIPPVSPLPTPIRSQGSSPAPSEGSLNMAETPVLPAPPEFASEPLTPHEKHPLISIQHSPNFQKHSYSDHFHKRFGSNEVSRSTGASPSGSPRSRSSKANFEVDVAVLRDKLHRPKSPRQSGVVRRHHSFNHDGDIRERPISVLGLVSTTRSDLSLEDLPIVGIGLPEDTDEARAKMRTFPDAHKARRSSRDKALDTPSPKEKKRPNDSSPRSIFHFHRHKKVKSPLASNEVESPVIPDVENTSPLGPPLPELLVSHTIENEPITTVPPYEGNPEESLSFDEMLACFDDYASATGTTNKTKPHKDEKVRRESPELRHKKEKKKNRRRSKTVSIDTDTMKAVRAAMAEKEKESPPQSKAPSKVQNLAREYSRMIRDHQRTRVFRRNSTVVEKPQDSLDSPDIKQNRTWLQQLRERRRTKHQSSQENLVPPETIGEEASESVLLEVPSGSDVRVKSSTLPRASAEENQTISRSPPHSPKTSSKLQRTTDSNYAEQGRFKGWVRSLVEKFSTKDK